MKKRLVLCGGGTGGHVFPALAVAEILGDECDLVWIGSKKGIEYRIVTGRGIPFRSIPAGKLRRYFSFRNMIDLFKVGGGLVVSLWHLARLRPDAVFSKGGFVTVPPVLAARLLGIPVISHESDFDPGLATRLNARSSVRVCVPYPETAAFFGPGMAAKVRHTGNPVRSDIRSSDPADCWKTTAMDPSRPLLFVQGGSLGARQVNQVVDAVLDRVLAMGWNVVHQRGEGDWGRTDVAGRYLSRPFFAADYGPILAAASLCLSRAGAGSIWEMGLMAKPALLLPLDSGSRGDQVRNAEHCAKAGAAVVLGQTDPAAEVLAFLDRLGEGDAAARQAVLGPMAAAWKDLVVPDGAERVAGVIREVLDGRHQSL